ncbi:nuclear transport factor 2 family protein [Aurantiacibacter sp. MUD11]|uniref:nuclear transport factor 2 family protein n=1 Tax=Aurantiacibacter sp. MUD11 TaxID=3003265 RepID=UPI0022AA4E79|nr:nuclear transport factor 2 family protein [Aurantiacibacter sp. MUD11]WAT17749.1 nuclear transport factor 2 family protein [Aurantiacibacter sp. MUD11]
MSFDYEAYLACFLTGDDDSLVERFFAEDCEMRSASGVRRGHQGMREFLHWAHDGVRECPRVQHYLQDERTVFADIDMDFHATSHRPDFPFGELHPGDSLTVKFLARYDLDEDQKVRVLTTAAWPPGVGVTTLPPLGGHPSQLAAYHAYAAAFSNGDPQRYTRFYTDDVVLELGSVPRIEGAQGIADFYTAMFRTVRETLTIHDLDASDERIVVDCTSRFTAIADAPDFVVAPLAKDDFAEVGVKVTYTLRDGRICHIGVQRTRDPVVTRA